jgi:hypothetical protein
MWPVDGCADVLSPLVTLWFMGLGAAIMIGVAALYLRQTWRCFFWPLALIVQTGKRCLGSLVQAVVRWIGRYLRDW